MRRFLFLTLVFVLLASSFVWAQEVSGPVFVSDPVVPTLTPAIRDLPTFVPDPNLYNMEAKRRDDHGIIVPDIDMPPHSNPLAERQSRAPGPGASAFGDPLRQFRGGDLHLLAAGRHGRRGPQPLSSRVTTARAGPESRSTTRRGPSKRSS